MTVLSLTRCVAAAAVIGAASIASAQAPQAAPTNSPATPAAVEGVSLPNGYLIGADDVLSVVFWRDKDMSVDVTVRPDGKISLPLLNEIQAAGLTPEQLRSHLIEAASKYIEEPNATVVVREVRSRKVFITGNVAKPASYPLTGEMNVIQLIAQAGGLLEYADSKNISVMRTENGRQQYFRVNYNDVIKRRHVEQNITLKPGDTVIVP